jgi:hypothetical protein
MKKKQYNLLFKKENLFDKIIYQGSNRMADIYLYFDEIFSKEKSLELFFNLFMIEILMKCVAVLCLVLFIFYLRS